MESEIFINLIIFTVLLFLSAIFSGSETAFFSLTEAEKDEFSSEESKKSSYILFLLQKPQRLLTTIVVGNTFVNIGIASLAAFITHDYARVNNLSTELVIFLDIVVVTFVILIVSEIFPKVVAVRKNIEFIKRFGRLIWVAYLLFLPVTVIINRFVGGMSRWAKAKDSKPMITDTEIKTLMEYGEASGELDKDEKEMITSIFEFSETTVKEIIVPRTDMIAFNIRDSFEALINLIQKTHFSRIPVYENKIDNIIGILYVKDLLPFLVGDIAEKQIDVRSLLRPVYFVPEQKNIDTLLKEFQNERIHIAIVVDEYGGTAGVVTLEDVLEEIVGEIQDEFDEERPLIRTSGKDAWYVSGKAPLEDLEEAIAISLPEIEDVETVGGLILSIKGAVPQQGEELQFENLLFNIEKVTRQRIIEVKVRVLPDKEKQENGNSQNSPVT